MEFTPKLTVPEFSATRRRASAPNQHRVELLNAGLASLRSGAKFTERRTTLCPYRKRRKRAIPGRGWPFFLWLMQLSGSLDRLDLVGRAALACTVIRRDGEIVHPADGQTVHGR